MNLKNDLEARAKAYAAFTAACAADPANALYLEQVRRDVERDHKWLASQGKP